MNNRILIIDESEHYTNMIVNRLTNYGYDEVFLSTNGTDGVHKFEMLKPEVVVIDSRLSDVDGFKLCQQIKKMTNISTKVILTVKLK